MAVNRVKIEETTIIDALNKKVAEIFDASEVAEIYVDTVPQDFIRPSIAILEIELPNDDGLKTDDYEIQDHYYMFDLSYFPTKKENIYSEFRKISHRIKTELTGIDLADDYFLDRYEGVDNNVVNGVGHSIITFFIRAALIDTTSKPKINRINENTKIGG